MITDSRVDGNDITDIIAGADDYSTEGMANRHPSPIRMANGLDVPERLMGNVTKPSLDIATRAELVAQATGEVVEIVGDDHEQVIPSEAPYSHYEARLCCPVMFHR